MTNADVIVIGAGAMGLASTYYLAKAGLRVVCLDRFTPPHPWSASVGDSRLFRQAYFEDPRYIPLLKRAMSLWKKLELESSSTLFHTTGFLVMSDNAHDVHDKLVRNACAHDVPLELLTHQQICQRYPSLRVPSNFHASFEPQAGLLRPERVLMTLMHGAREYGAAFLTDERVLSYHAHNNNIEVRTSSTNYFARSLVIAAGPFINQLTTLPMSITIKRAVQFWFRSSPSFALSHQFPSFAFATESDFIYGFPSIDDNGIKLARYEPSATIEHPLSTGSDYEESEYRPVATALKRFLPDIEPRSHRHKVCFYSLTTDENFLIDCDPSDSRIVFAVGGSGHAFKFTPIIGELVAQLVLKKPHDFDVEFLRFR